MTDVIVLGRSSLAVELRHRVAAGGGKLVAQGAPMIVADAGEAGGRLLQAAERHAEAGLPILATAMLGSAAVAGRGMIRPERLAIFGALPPLQDGRVEWARHPRMETGMAACVQQLLLDLFGAVDEVGDAACLVVPRIVLSLIGEAAFMVSEQHVAQEDLDTAMHYGASYPHGLLEWADRIGPTEVVAGLRALQTEYGEAAYRIAPWLLRRAAASLPLN